MQNITVYKYDTYLMKEEYLKVVKTEAVEILIEIFSHVCRHGITLSKYADPRFTNRNG